MKLTMRLVCLLVLAGFLAMLTGCAGGSPTGTVARGSDDAGRQVAAAMFVQQWAEILWGLMRSQIGTVPPVWNLPPVFDPGPPPTLTSTGTSPDGTTWRIVLNLVDGSAQVDIVYPDGTGQTITQSPTVFAPGPPPTFYPTLTNDWTVASAGLSVAYTTVVTDPNTPWTAMDDTTDMQGSSTLAGGITQDFIVVLAPGLATINSDQSDGSQFSMNVPLVWKNIPNPNFPPIPPPTLFSGYYPDNSVPTTGSYSGPGFNINFTLNSTAADPNRWAAMASDFGGGLTGDFSLEPDFAGDGQLMRGAQVEALMSWDRMGVTSVSFLTGETSATSPAGAAQDFLLHRWQTLTSLQFPAP